MSTNLLKHKPTASSGIAHVRLERSYATLMQMKAKLTSYWLEPTTATMHETKEALLFKLELLVKANLELMSALDTLKSSIETQVAVVDNQLTRVNHLEESIKDYIFAKITAK